MSVWFRAADVLLSGAVMNRIFQPHEAHIPYVLQVSLTCTNDWYFYRWKMAQSLSA